MENKKNSTKVAENSGGKFQVGQKRPKNSGRKAGTPNKKTVGLEAKLQEKGLDVAAEMINLFNTVEDDGLKYNILKELMKYVYPQRKAVDMELTGKDGAALGVQKVFVSPQEHKESLEHIENVLND